MKKVLSPKYIILYIFIIIALSVYAFSSAFLDNRVNDFFIKAYTNIFNVQSSDNVVLVVLDDESLSKIKWPWKRNLFSHIFDYLEYDAKAAAVVFQNLISFTDTYNEETDYYFYENIFFHKRLINSYILVSSNLSSDILPDNYINIFNTKSNIIITDKRKKKLQNSYKAVMKMPKEFLENSNRLAVSLIPEDNDEIVRNYIPVFQMNDVLYPSLALSAYSLYTGITNFVLTDDFLCSSDDCKSLKIPVISRKGKDYIGNIINADYSYYSWYKPISEFYTHKSYSAIDVLESYEALRNGKQPKINPSEFKDKIVIIGLNADRNVWEQLSETPILKKQADIDIHATMIDNMLANNFVKVKKNIFSLFITFLFSVFVIFAFKNLKLNLIFASLLSLIYFIYYTYEYFNGVYVAPISSILTIFSCCILKEMYSLITTDKTTEMIKHALGKYVSKDVMKSVLQNIDKLKLGGIRTNVTVLFVDIRNFTHFAENNSPSEVTNLLNEYFSTIEPVIAKHHGIINKYLGDGALAVFGEPVKTENHALNAVLCAFEILEKVKILKEKFISEGRPGIDVGIGINSGEVFAGNIGTEERLEYTVIGDNVNLAYRIEALNQVLKTKFLISQYTYELVKDNVDVLKLTDMDIKGKSLPIDIYEVLKIK